jgi:hypothetical protein
MAFLTVQIAISTLRMNAGAPEHLVGQCVAEVRHNCLIHQCRFDCAAAILKLLLKSLATETNSIRTLVADDLTNAVPVIR